MCDFKWQFKWLQVPLFPARALYNTGAGPTFQPPVAFQSLITYSYHIKTWRVNATTPKLDVDSSPSRDCCKKYEIYPSKKHLKLKFRMPLMYFSDVRSIWNLAQSTAVILPCFEQNFKTIGGHNWILWMKDEFQRNFLIPYRNSPWCRMSWRCWRRCVTQW